MGVKSLPSLSDSRLVHRFIPDIHRQIAGIGFAYKALRFTWRRLRGYNPKQMRTGRGLKPQGSYVGYRNTAGLLARTSR